MAVRTLDLLTNHKSIASDGYRYGLEFLDGHRNTFHEEQEKDKMSMTRYVNLLDTAFQNFSSLGIGVLPHGQGPHTKGSE
jgi:hypothetical protein